MIDLREAAYGSYGAWRLAVGDAHGIDYFDGTERSFWRSFQAAVLLAPVFAVLVALRLMEMRISAGPARIVAVEAIAYVIGWVAFPLVIFYLAEAMGRGHRYFRYIAAYNWSMVWQMLLFLAVSAVVAIDVLPRSAQVLATLAATVAVLLYQWFVARTGLGASKGLAIAIVGIDLVISVMLNSVANAML